MKLPEKNSDSREIILSKLRGTVSRDWEQNWPDEVPEGDVFPRITDLLNAFKEELEGLGGEVFVERNEAETLGRLQNLASQRNWGPVAVVNPVLKEKCIKNNIAVTDFDPESGVFEAGLTGCEALIALTGSVMVSSIGSGRKMNVFPPVHVVLAHSNQIVESIKDGFIKIEEKYDHLPSQISLISGPSRTADIEKTLVMGAHGPRELIVLIQEE
ncbi:LutC/YkgG family protein [Anaerophaga thermohalophila]|uniref:LutC/YkgG family protein n=1 Tax=Anaerophaga thermohalophila TaxID=177400 RepID=UPI00031C53EE|nr:lactate utilization protein [Anaerophaga thermohalophila]